MSEKSAVPTMPVPAFGDMAKAANDLINRDFYHTSQATLDVKLKAPNGTNITVKGKQGFDGVTSGSVEGKQALKPHGTHRAFHSSSLSFGRAAGDKGGGEGGGGGDGGGSGGKSGRSSGGSDASSRITRGHKPAPSAGFVQMLGFFTMLPAPLRSTLHLAVFSLPAGPYPLEKLVLTYRHRTGITITQSWTTASLLDTKVELTDVVAPGAKVDLQNLWNPSKAASAAQKLTFAFKNPNVHSRAFINYAQASGNIDAVVDVTAGHEGFLVGGEAGYDVQKAAVTKYSLGVAYQTPAYTASLTGTQNLSVIAASFYQKVNGSVEVGAKAGYDVQASKASGLELASKYRLDPLSFAKVKVNDRGIAALAYSTKLNAGTTIGLGLSLDTNKLNEAGHKIGTSLTFEG